ncbi:MAG: NADH-quinone oxidoreductase subunit NuoG [Methylophilaceae bacterium]
MIKVKINGKAIKVQEKTTIIEVADNHGIEIPRFCYHKKLSVAANCRMCLVEVKNFPKPLPACATQVADGMEIFTKSKQTKDCQQSVMEFLLINHPLDCPICDQGGECDLQDTAMAYGSPKSRYQEEKRVVLNKNLGPLVSTDLNRCIQCSRCVRFLKEVGGMQELGLIGRGEHAEISAYVKKSVESEISGNVIDLCPVGALTSKPFRYSARTWEMIRKSTISPHDSLGSHLEAHVKDGNVMRVLPRENEDLNECWISDRDRFSYMGINHQNRVKTPLIKKGATHDPISWEAAFQLIEKQLHPKQNQFKADDVVFFTSNQTTMEEAFLIKQMAEYFNSHQIKFDAANGPAYIKNPSLNTQVKKIEEFESIILLGSQLRNQNPLILQRLRKMALHGKSISVINHIDFNLQVNLDQKVIKPITDFKKLFQQILKDIKIDSKKTSKTAEQRLSKIISNKTLLLIGEDVYSHPEFLKFAPIINDIIDETAMQFGCLPAGANSVGLHQLFSHYKNTVEIKNYQASLTVNLDPAFDFADSQMHEMVMQKSKFNILISPFLNQNNKHYDLILPSATHFENEGSFLNIESRLQIFSQTIVPKFESKPLWKILRVMGNYIECPDFEFETCSQITNKIANKIHTFKKLNLVNEELNHHKVNYRLANINQSDLLVRKSKALQDILHLRNEK